MEKEKKCINDISSEIERGRKIDRETISAIIDLMPESMNPLSMAEVFYHLLGVYGMDNSKSLKDITGVIAGVLIMRSLDGARGETKPTKVQ